MPRPRLVVAFFMNGIVITMHCDLLGLIQTDIEAGGRCDTLVIMLLSFALWPHNYLVVCLTRLGPHLRRIKFPLLFVLIEEKMEGPGSLK